MRFDSPLPVPIDYEVYKDCKILGVPISKGFQASINILALHFDPTNWHEPLKFLPERFDPEHEYFKTPDGKMRHPYSYLPFSSGARGCPGQSLAKLEAKLLFTYLILNMEYNVNNEQLNNDHISFSLTSQFHLELTISKILDKSS